MWARGEERGEEVVTERGSSFYKGTASGGIQCDQETAGWSMESWEGGALGRDAGEASGHMASAHKGICL